MIAEDEHITIAEILALLKKGKHITLLEKETLDSMMNMLRETYGYLDAHKRYKLLNNDQRTFVSDVLCVYLKHQVPKLDQVLSVYDLNVNTVFVWKDTYLGMSP